jgi:hypothetical protein
MGDTDSGLAIGQKVVTFARGKLGQKVLPRGECFDLADAALTGAGAKSAKDFGTITTTADYVWGDEIDLKDAGPGDILQFRDFVIEITTTVITITKKPGYSDGMRRETSTITIERPHHTAIVESNDGDGKLTILEQNFKLVKKVKRNVIPWKAGTMGPTKKVTPARGGGSTEVTTTIATTVEGTLWVYRPKVKAP